jgi:hypothetical protein
VVAKLLLRFLGQDRPRDAYFLLRGIQELHRDPVEVVLERHALAAVAEMGPDTFALIGTRTPEEEEVWGRVEEQGKVPAEEAHGLLPDGDGGEILSELARRRVVFLNPSTGDFQALSDLLKDLA